MAVRPLTLLLLALSNIGRRLSEWADRELERGENPRETFTEQLVRVWRLPVRIKLIKN